VTPVRLRPYQEDAVAAVIGARREGIRRMVLALPTGAGKTVVFSELIRRARHPALVLAHRDELIEQARLKVCAALQGERRLVAVEQGTRHAPRDASVVIASIRSLHGDRLGRLLAGRELRLVIYDECHHAVADDNRRILEQMGALDPEWPGTLVGVTATTRRADGRGLSEVFERIVYERTLRQMIDDGYLRPLRGLRVQTGLDIGRVSVRGEDFDDHELEEAIDIETRNLLVARSIQELARDRRTIAFCIGVRHAEHLSAALNRVGVRAGMVCGEMPKAERKRTLARFRQGALQVITNVGVLTEGFDDPGVSAIAMVRPTRSESMYIQCVGRGMRPSPEAGDCLVLDFVDLSHLQLVTAATLDAGPIRATADEASDDDDDPGNEGGGGAPIEDVDDRPATLQEILDRVAAFDPLLATQREEVAAISLHAWISLGARGMMLHFTGLNGNLRVFELRAESMPRRGVEVWLDDEKLTRFSTMQAAVEAVDLELPKVGDPSSAAPSAGWRQEEIDDTLRTALARLTPPRFASTVGEALAHLALGNLPERRGAYM
jgi:superfamily II DNA or RNA helicase